MPDLYGVMVTFRRPREMADALRRVLGQSLALRCLYVVDNDPSAESERAVRGAAENGRVRVEYLAAPENLGPAGGWALGTAAVLQQAEDADWVLNLDDNNPPEQPTELEQVFHFALQQGSHRPHLGGVAIGGARFNWRSGRIERVPDAELNGAVLVDYLPGGHLSMYQVCAIRDAGSFAGDLFFGGVEVEYGLRLRRAGYTLLAHGELWLARRDHWNRRDVQVQPSRMCSIHWQRYYRIRNYVAMMRRFGRGDLALRWAAIQCLAKPAWSCLHSPRLGWQGFRQASRACWHAYTGRMGRTVDPPAGASQRDYLLTCGPNRSGNDENHST